MKTQTFYVSGIHCDACKILIEDIISEQPQVEKVVVNMSREEIMIEGELIEDSEVLAAELSKTLSPHGYTLSTAKINKTTNKKLLIFALPLGLIILGLFFILQRSGLTSIGINGTFTPLTALLIGVIASLSTCLAVVGGLIFSLSAQIAKNTSKFRPIVSFHLGRLIGFAILGGILGMIGQAFAINYLVTASLGLIVALVMIIVGLNLLDLFSFTKKIKFTLSPSLFRRFTKIESGKLAPFIVGVGTFFLPCGFTQSMQLVALSSGSFSQGALVMLLFSLGTLPILGLLSFGSFQFSQSRFAPLFFKTAGVVVIGLGIFAFLSGLAGFGIINPLLNI